MPEYKLKPSRWYYGLAFLIPIFTCLGAAFVVYLSVPELPGALDAIGVKNLTRVAVPGSVDVSFPKKGAYAVYYEYRSVIDGVSYARNEHPPMMTCQLRSKVNGDPVRLAPTNVKGNVYTTHYPERAGVMYRQISIDQPGIYTISCLYPDGSTYPKSVLAVGPNYVLEFFNIAAKPIAACIGGALAFMCACGFSLIIIGFVAFKRHQSKKILAPQG